MMAASSPRNRPNAKPSQSPAFRGFILRTGAGHSRRQFRFERFAVFPYLSLPMKKLPLVFLSALTLCASAIVFFALAPADPPADAVAAAQTPPRGREPSPARARDGFVRAEGSSSAAVPARAQPAAVGREDAGRSPIAASFLPTIFVAEETRASQPVEDRASLEQPAARRKPDSAARVRTTSAPRAQGVADIRARLHPAAVPAVTGATAASHAGERVFELAPGVQAPAALAAADPALSLTPQQEALMAQIAGQFADEIERVAADPSAEPESIGQVWVAAQEDADARFRKMFGDAAYVRQKAAVAREALGQ